MKLFNSNGTKISDLFYALSFFLLGNTLATAIPKNLVLVILGIYVAVAISKLNEFICDWKRKKTNKDSRPS